MKHLCVHMHAYMTNTKKKSEQDESEPTHILICACIFKKQGEQDESEPTRRHPSPDRKRGRGVF